MRLLGLAQTDPTVPITGSGAAAKYLFDAVARRHELVHRAGVDLTRPQRALLAAATFRPSRKDWQMRFYWNWNLALNLRSFNSRRVIRRLDEPVDVVLQVFGLFHTHGAPFALYVDNTAELSRRHWPAWVAVEGRALERLYAWERRLYRDALHVFSQGTPAARSVVSFYGVPEDRVSVVGGGANFDVLPERTGAQRDPVVLYVGADWARKGGDVLIRAFRKVRARNRHARLQIVGTSEPAPEPGVEVVGFVSDRGRLSELYAKASVYCLPSRYEPYGLSIAEAMAHELPCVVTRVGGLADVVLDGQTGLVVPPEDEDALADALLRLLDDPVYARRLGTNARSRVETHQNWDAVVERMTPVLERFGAPSSGLRRPSRFQRGAAVETPEPARRGSYPDD